MSPADFSPGQKVRYIPSHADGDRGHPDCEDGEVSSINKHFVFVRYYRKRGMTGPQATNADHLIAIL